MNKELMLLEHQKLNQEIRDMQLEAYKLERVWVIGAGSLYSWIFINASQVNVVTAIIALSIPLLLAIIINYRIKGFGAKMGDIAEYIREIECEMNKNDCGYEHFVQKKRSKHEFRKYGKTIMLYFYFQMLLSAAGITVFVIQQVAL